MGLFCGNMLNTKFETCSKEVQLGIKWLEERISKGEWDTYFGPRNDKSKYFTSDAVEFYVLMKVDSPLINEYLLDAENEPFWDLGELFDDSFLLWYLAKMGLSSNNYFKERLDFLIKDYQTVRGYIQSNTYEHTGPMRVLVLLEPKSRSLNMAIKYFLDNLENYQKDYRTLAVGILALSEIDYFKYKNLLEQLCNELKILQHSDGYWGYEKNSLVNIEITSLMISCISRVFGVDDPSVKLGIDWIKKIQKSNGSWGNHLEVTAHAILALIDVGNGPKISLETNEIKEMLIQQKILRAQSHFVYTCPPHNQIKDKIKNMLNNATTRVLICSRFITEFWADIVKLKNDNPNLDLRIITVSKSDAKRDYKGEGKKFIEPAFDGLQRTLKDNFRTNTLLHSRLYIIDDEVLVSSADITTEQLEKEYNAGVWTKNEETLETSIKFFEKIWTDT